MAVLRKLTLISKKLDALDNLKKLENLDYLKTLDSSVSETLSGMEKNSENNK